MISSIRMVLNQHSGLFFDEQPIMMFDRLDCRATGQVYIK
jgi:hypothetical protein